MNRANAADVQYGTPTAKKGSQSRPPAGRRCAASGCETVLSTYNSALTCWLHSSATTRHALAPRWTPARPDLGRWYRRDAV